MIGARTRCLWGENLCATSSTFAGRRHMIGKVVTGCVAILPYHTATQDRGSECRDFGFISRIVTALVTTIYFGCSLVDLLIFPIYFQFRKNKVNKTVWPPPLDCTLGWARKRRLAASFEKTAQSDCHWCLNEMKVGAKRKKQDEQADIRLFFQTVSK